jgi:hypothetical protein
MFRIKKRRRSTKNAHPEMKKTQWKKPPLLLADEELEAAHRIMHWLTSTSLSRPCSPNSEWKVSSRP